MTEIPVTPDHKWREIRVWNRSLGITNIATAASVAFLINPLAGGLLATAAGIVFTINAHRIDKHITKP